MHTALHNSHLLPLQGAEHQLTLVAGGGGVLEVGNFSVGHDDGVLHEIAQITQAGAQDHGHLGLEIAQAVFQKLCAFLILCKGKVHVCDPP